MISRLFLLISVFIPLHAMQDAQKNQISDKEIYAITQSLTQQTFSLLERLNKKIKEKIDQHDQLAAGYGALYLRLKGRNNFMFVHDPMPHEVIAESEISKLEARNRMDELVALNETWGDIKKLIKEKEKAMVLEPETFAKQEIEVTALMLLNDNLNAWYCEAPDNYRTYEKDFFSSAQLRGPIVNQVCYLEALKNKEKIRKILADDSLAAD